MEVPKFKRIVILTLKKIKHKTATRLNLNILKKHCYTRLCRSTDVIKAFNEIEAANISCHYIVVDDVSYGNGIGRILGSEDK